MPTNCQLGTGHSCAVGTRLVMPKTLLQPRATPEKRKYAARSQRRGFEVWADLRKCMKNNSPNTLPASRTRRLHPPWVPATPRPIFLLRQPYVWARLGPFLCNRLCRRRARDRFSCSRGFRGPTFGPMFPLRPKSVFFGTSGVEFHFPRYRGAVTGRGHDNTSHCPRSSGQRQRLALQP